MAGHSRPKDGVASLAYVPAIHVLLCKEKTDVDARHKAGHDVERTVQNRWRTQYAYSVKIGSTEPFHSPWYLASISSAGVTPRATLSCSGRR